MSRLCASVDIVWTTSHCDIEENQEDDELAKAVLDTPFKDQLLVPIEFSNFKTVTRRRKNPLTQDLEEPPEELGQHWKMRRAQVYLN